MADQRRGGDNDVEMQMEGTVTLLFSVKVENRILQKDRTLSFMQIEW